MQNTATSLTTIAELASLPVPINQYRRSQSPLTPARNAQRLLDIGVSVREVATAFGVSEGTVRNWKVLLEKLDPSITLAVERGEIAPTTALILAPLGKLRQKEEWAAIKAAGPLTGAELRARIANAEPKPARDLQKITALIAGAVSGKNTREDYLFTLNQIARVVLGKSFAQLVLESPSEL